LASSPRTERAGPADPLQELRSRLCEGNPELYRHLALYLQVLRQVLPVRVDRACFHLAAQIQPRRYPALPEQDRRLLHRRLNTLVRRCTSLLTVEQLATLAAQIARERQRQERRQRQQLIQHFGSSSGEEESGPPQPPGLDSPPSQLAERLPEGSVNLDGSLPFSAGLLRALGGLAGRPQPVESPDLPWGPRAEAQEDEASEDGEHPAPVADLPPLLQRLLASKQAASTLPSTKCTSRPWIVWRVMGSARSTPQSSMTWNSRSSAVRSGLMLSVKPSSAPWLTASGA
jgi:hypothetical protein